MSLLGQFTQRQLLWTGMSQCPAATYATALALTTRGRGNRQQGAQRGLHTNSRRLAQAVKETDGAASGTLGKMELYSSYHPTPVSIQHFIDFGKHGGMEGSFLFLRREVPVRLANIFKELQLLPPELRLTKGCVRISNQYLQSFEDILSFEAEDSKDPKVLKEFTSKLINIRERHADTVTVMAEAVFAVKSSYQKMTSKERKEGLPRFNSSIQYFLDRLYTSRISTRMLINQHTLLFGENRQMETNSDGVKIVGTIDPQCALAPIVCRAYENARFLAEQYYMTSPELVVSAWDTTDETVRKINECYPETFSEREMDNIKCVLVPAHMYHILFELFKNAMRATIEHHGEECLKLPPVRVNIVKSKQDVSVKISDMGGGIPRSNRAKVFQYLYTTAQNPVLTNSTSDNEPWNSDMGQMSAPLAGYGYGLPLSRLYARYFAGDLNLYSVDGYGTDAVLYLQAHPEDARERLPVYHEAGSKKIYEAQLAADDWTSTDYKESNGRKRKNNKK